jgi:hypothetical protein
MWRASSKSRRGSETTNLWGALLCGDAFQGPIFTCKNTRDTCIAHASSSEPLPKPRSTVASSSSTFASILKIMTS